MLRCSAVIMAAALGGCSSFSYLGETYASMPSQIITTKADTWRVFDKVAEGKVLVQRDPGGAATPGVVGSLGLKPANAAAPQPDYQEAAEAFLARSGRSCRIKDSYLVVAPSWEFAYECDAAPAVAGTQPIRSK